MMRPTACGVAPNVTGLSGRCKGLLVADRSGGWLVVERQRAPRCEPLDGSLTLDRRTRS